MGNSLATAAAVDLVNPYWDALRDRVREDRWLSFHPVNLVVGGIDDPGRRLDRFASVGRYSWTITNPETVAFVAEHAGARVIDPLAGTGYWAYLLGQLGVDVSASDIAPPGLTENKYHREGVTHVGVALADAVEAVTVLGEDRTLLLSWPPYSEPIGAQVLAAYGCCGDDDMWTALQTGWRVVADHTPVQWWGLHDTVTVYQRLTKEL